MSNVGFAEDFGRAVRVEREKARIVLQKKASAIYKLLKPSKTQMGNSTHETYLGRVEYEVQDAQEVFQDTPVVQHPSVSTRTNKASQSRILVGVPRKVAQTRGLSVSALAQTYTGPITAAKMRRLETQIGTLFSESYRLNVIMDGLDEQGGLTSAVFPTIQNVTGVIDRTSPDGRVHFMDIMEVRLRLADNQGSSVTMSEVSSMPAARTIDDTSSIIFCDNKTWFAFLVQNRETFFNRDFSKHYTSTFDTDGFKFKSLHDMAVVTTAQAISSVDSFANDTTNKRFDNSGVAVTSGGTNLISSTRDLRPMYIFPRGAFDMQRPSADDYQLTLKEIQTKSFNQAFYGECNVYGKRIYDELMFRLWIDVNNRTAFS